MASNASCSSSSVGVRLTPRRRWRSSRNPCARWGKIVYEDALLEPLAQLFRVIAASFGDRIKPAVLVLAGGRSEGRSAEEQPPVTEGFVRVGLARGDQGLGQIDLVKVGRPRMGVAAVEPPLAAVGHDDPIGNAFVEGGHHARARVFLGRLLVEIEVGAVEPAVPGVDEGRRFAAVADEQIVRLGVRLAGGLVDLGLESEKFEDWLEELLADNLLALVEPACTGVGQKLLHSLERLGGVVAPGGILVQAGEQVVVGKQRTVAEVVFAERRRLEHAA